MYGAVFRTCVQNYSELYLGGERASTNRNCYNANEIVDKLNVPQNASSTTL